MKMNLTKDGWKSQFKSALIVSAALAVVTFLQQIDAIDFGAYEGLTFGAISWAISYVKNWIGENYPTSSEAE